MAQKNNKDQAVTTTKKTNAMAIVGFVLSFFASLIGMIISIIALKKIKKTGEGGKNLAIGGVIIGAIMTVVSVVISVVMISSLGLRVDKALQYDEAITDVNHLTSSYSRISDLEWTSADFDDVDSVQTAYSNDAQTIRTAIAEVGQKIDELKDDRIFKEDDEAKKLLDNLEKKYADFKDTYNEVADVYDAISRGDYSASSSLDASSILNDDVSTEINALVNYLNTKLIESK